MKFLKRKQPLTYAYAKQEGWEAERTKGDHVLFTKNGMTVYAGSTPSCPRADKNCRAMLRRKDRS